MSTNCSYQLDDFVAASLRSRGLAGPLLGLLGMLGHRAVELPSWGPRAPGGSHGTRQGGDPSRLESSTGAATARRKLWQGVLFANFSECFDIPTVPGRVYVQVLSQEFSQVLWTSSVPQVPFPKSMESL